MSVGCFLGFVNWSDICKRYMEGEFSNKETDSTGLVKFKAIKAKDKDLTFYSEEDSYLLVSREGVEFVVHTDNCVSTKKEIRIIQCGWCGKGHPSNREENTPIILNITLRELIVPSPGKHRLVKRYEVETGRICCDFHCASALADRDYPENISDYIRFVHRYMYPESGHLTPAKNSDVIDFNGGSITYEKYKGIKRESFISVLGMTFLPVKQSYGVLA